MTAVPFEPQDGEAAEPIDVDRARRAADIRRGLGHHSEADAIERRLAERNQRRTYTVTGTSADRSVVYAALAECWPHFGHDELAVGADRIIDRLLGRRG